MVKVLISGAGIAGLSLALRLRQRGLAPVVVERSPRLRDGGYMLGLADPGLDAAERVGVADAFRAARRVPWRLAYVDAKARERFAIDRLVGERWRCASARRWSPWRPHGEVGPSSPLTKSAWIDSVAGG